MLSMWETTMLVGKTLWASPGANVLLKSRVMVASAETGWPYRTFTKQSTGHLS